MKKILVVMLWLLSAPMVWAEEVVPYTGTPAIQSSSDQAFQGAVLRQLKGIRHEVAVSRKETAALAGRVVKVEEALPGLAQKSDIKSMQDSTNAALQKMDGKLDSLSQKSSQIISKLEGMQSWGLQLLFLSTVVALVLIYEVVRFIRRLCCSGAERARGFIRSACNEGRNERPVGAAARDIPPAT